MSNNLCNCGKKPEECVEMMCDYKKSLAREIDALSRDKEKNKDNN